MSETPPLLTFDSSVIFAVIKRETYHDLSAIDNDLSSQYGQHESKFQILLHVDIQIFVLDSPLLTTISEDKCSWDTLSRWKSMKKN